MADSREVNEDLKRVGAQLGAKHWSMWNSLLSVHRWSQRAWLEEHIERDYAATFGAADPAGVEDHQKSA